MRLPFKIALQLLMAALALPAWAAPIPVKVVVVTQFEVGADTGDAPGELQFWVERDRLDRVFPLPAAFHAARMNGQGEMAILTGEGTAHAAASIMALGLDPRFDFTHAYWIVAGIAGASPEKASLGSAVWARWVVDGDMAYEIDAREIPPDWPTGYVPLHQKRPYETPQSAPHDGQVFALNRSLAEWAFQLTRDLTLGDTERMREFRGHFDGQAANRPPFVTVGDELSSSTYWHGKLFDAWAAEWVRYYTGGQGDFATTAMEDSGTLESLQLLAKAGKVDANRVLVLRTVSNYDRQPRDMTAAESLASQRASKSGAFLPALESAYAVGHVVVNELLTHWPKYERTAIGAAADR
jgi:purine nucleoside permease